MVVLTGENGAGKTNILEAIACLSNGKSIRKASMLEMGRIEDGGHHNWTLFSKMSNPEGQAKIGLSVAYDIYDDVQKVARKDIVVNGKTLGTVQELRQYSKSLWLLPQMDRLFIDGIGSRRKFLDRLTGNLYIEHNNHLVSYEKLMRERLKLLKENKGNIDKIWILSIEKQMAQYATKIAINRISFLEKLSNFCSSDASLFPAAILDIGCRINHFIKNGSSSDEIEDILLNQWKNTRESDSNSGITNFGVHRSDFLVYHENKKMLAELCSTGEQKSLLITIILANAKLYKATLGGVPIILLDEIVAHLDSKHREMLFAELLSIGGQVFFTGTEIGLFSELDQDAQFVEVNSGYLFF